MTPDLSYYWGEAREQCEDNKWDGKKNKKKVWKKHLKTCLNIFILKLVWIYCLEDSAGNFVLQLV